MRMRESAELRDVPSLGSVGAEEHRLRREVTEVSFFISFGRGAVEIVEHRGHASLLRLGACRFAGIARRASAAQHYQQNSSPKRSMGHAERSEESPKTELNRGWRFFASLRMTACIGEPDVPNPQ